MLACGHDQQRFGQPICAHMRVCREDVLKYVRWYVGSGLNAELLCQACAEEREKGLHVELGSVCEECFERAVFEVGYPVGIRGKPEIRVRSETTNATLKETTLPKDFGKIVDIAPID